MSKETVSTLLTYLAFVVLVIGFAFMLRENTRLKVVNQHLEYELVETQNKLNEQLFINQALENGQWEEEE